MNATTRTRSDVKREAIIAAAKQAFQEFGVTATSMDKLAEMANVSKRTVYNHFSAKEELVMHLIKELWSKSMVSVQMKFNPDAPLAPQLTELLLVEIELFTGEEYMELSRVAFGYFFYHPERLQDEVAQLTAQETVIQRWLKAATEAGCLKTSALDEGEKELSSLIKGQCFWPQLMKIEAPLTHEQKQQIAQKMATLFLHYYASEHQRSADPSLL